MNHDNAARWDRIMHLGEQIAVPAGIGGILADLAWGIIGPGDTFFTATALVCSVVFMVGVIISATHDPSECLVCFEAFPLEHAEAMARRHMGSLRGYHLYVLFLGAVFRGLLGLWTKLRRGKAQTTYTISMGTASLAVWMPLMVLTPFAPRPWGGIISMTTILWVMVVGSRHRRLEMWCPWCRDDDDGDDPEEVPDPDPANGKQINA